MGQRVHQQWREFSVQFTFPSWETFPFTGKGNKEYIHTGGSFLYNLHSPPGKHSPSRERGTKSTSTMEGVFCPIYRDSGFHSTACEAGPALHRRPGAKTILKHSVFFSLPFSLGFSFFSSTSSRLPPRDSVRLPDLDRSALADPVFPARRSVAWAHRQHAIFLFFYSISTLLNASSLQLQHGSYRGLFPTSERTRCALVTCDWMSDCSFIQHVSEVVYLQHRLVVTWLVHA